MYDQSYLYHHGVKGMKWGVRKDKRGGLPSKRKIKKLIKTANKTPNNNKHTKAVNKKIYAELSKTKEGKEYNNLVKNMASLEDVAKQYGRSMAYTKEQADAINKIQTAYVNKGASIAKKYENQLASAMIKDLGYKDTQAGRDYLKKHKLV